MNRASAFLALALAFAGCAKPPPPKPSVEDVQAARRAAFGLDAAFNKAFMDRLEHDEDPVAVYLAYRDNAGPMTAAAAKEAGFELSRVALRVRNPQNKPDDWEEKQLNILQLAMETGLDAQQLEISALTVEEINGKRMQVFRWIKPIQMGEHCMTCHGDDISQKLLDLIRQDYTEDEATGYYPEEMRGAYAVRKVLGPAK